ncbi:MAG: phytanoyl-CoA dioxygenase family protein [Myxococcota bacterium]
MAIVTPEQKKEFDERGFLIFRGLLRPDEVQRFGAAVDRGVAERTQYETRPLAERSLYEQSFHQVLNLWEDSLEVRALDCHPRIAEIAANLLDQPALRIWHDQALYKEPGGRETDAHHDQPYWPLAQANTITAWMAFGGADETSGCMGYVPGSNHFNVKAFSNIFTSTGFDLEHGEEARGVPPEWTPAEPGDVIFHHGLTIHAARPNRSARTRRTHTIIYFADGSTRTSSKQRHPCVDRDGILPGALVNGPVTPIAWPRPPGDLPETPPLPEPRLRGWAGWKPS